MERAVGRFTTDALMALSVALNYEKTRRKDSIMLRNT
jgi:hypothetical protein